MVLCSLRSFEFCRSVHHSVGKFKACFRQPTITMMPSFSADTMCSTFGHTMHDVRIHICDSYRVVKRVLETIVPCIEYQQWYIYARYIFRSACVQIRDCIIMPSNRTHHRFDNIQDLAIGGLHRSNTIKVKSVALRFSFPCVHFFRIDYACCCCIVRLARCVLHKQRFDVRVVDNLAQHFRDDLLSNAKTNQLRPLINAIDLNPGIKIFPLQVGGH
mmetsp:Transcript_12542/g.18965  ORF Transcript_12542/g.18965 Transcript_12542/m.18965 type:complete len:216 (-) Transcript_12542:447-1094(-)